MSLLWSPSHGCVGAPLHRLRSEAHVWLARVKPAPSMQQQRRYHALLSAAERERYARFHFESDRYVYLLAHALLRTSLSRYAQTPPEQWKFRTNAYGRPEIDAGANTAALRFNLSHTRDLSACVVSLGCDCGIDVEYQRPLDDLSDLAQQVLSASERAAFNALPPTERQGRFFDYWTLKESYVKARGLGMSLALDQFSFRFSDRQLVGIEFAPLFDDDPKPWQFAVGPATLEHKLAVAIRRADGIERRLICRFVEP